MHVFNSLAHSTITTQTPSIQALTKGLTDLQVLSENEDHPGGCALSSISKDCNVYLLVKGRIDVDSEIAKAQAKLGKTNEARKRQEKLIAAADYQKKVKASVQEQDRKKVEDLKVEEESLSRLIEKFEGLRA